MPARLRLKPVLGILQNLATIAESVKVASTKSTSKFTLRRALPLTRCPLAPVIRHNKKRRDASIIESPTAEGYKGLVLVIPRHGLPLMPAIKNNDPPKGYAVGAGSVRRRF